MNNSKIKFWKFRRRSYLYLRSDELKKSGKTFSNSLWSVLIGLLIGIVIMAGIGANPMKYFADIFKTISLPSTFDRVLSWWSIYALGGISMAIAFRSGLFNIGAAGQMLSVATIIVLVGQNTNYSQGLNIIIIFATAIFVGALVAAIPGILKALFNVHEVVTTILMNWSIWFLMKYLFKIFNAIGTDHATLPLNENMSLDYNAMGRMAIIPIITVVIVAIIAIILLNKTTLGYKLKAVGENPDASKYAGINYKTKIITAMMISGAIAGLMGAFWVLTPGSKNISVAIDNLPLAGFDGIAVALVGANNPIGILLTGFIWAVLTIGSAAGASDLNNIPDTIASLIFAIIIYFSAISVLFTKLKPIDYISATLKRNKLKYINKKYKLETRLIWNYRWEKTILSFKLFILKLRMLMEYLTIIFVSSKKAHNLLDNYQTKINDLKHSHFVNLEEFKNDKEKLKHLFFTYRDAAINVLQSEKDLFTSKINESQNIKRTYKQKSVMAFKQKPHNAVKEKIHNLMFATYAQSLDAVALHDSNFEKQKKELKLQQKNKEVENYKLALKELKKSHLNWYKNLINDEKETILKAKQQENISNTSSYKVEDQKYLETLIQTDKEKYIIYLEKYISKIKSEKIQTRLTNKINNELTKVNNEGGK